MNVACIDFALLLDISKVRYYVLKRKFNYIIIQEFTFLQSMNVLFSQCN